MTTTTLRVGARLGEGRYTIKGRVGQGNMGEVFLARDDHLGVDVVLKFPVGLRSPAGDDHHLERFEAEVRSLIRLSHPHVVKVLDAGRHDGHSFVVMQYLEGGSLKDRTATGPDGTPRAMPPDSLRGWLVDVARALDFIHSQGFIHRDVKPANILFDAHGNAFLGDFGIIKAFAAEGEAREANALTAPGFLLGTPNYVAPEVVMGKEADGRVDQYALAMTVHEVLSGTNVMAGPSPSATIVNQMNLEPPRLHDVIPNIPVRLAEAVNRALSKDPSQRFESCTAFAREAVSGLASDPSESIPTLHSPFLEGVPDLSAATALAERPPTSTSTPASAGSQADAPPGVRKPVWLRAGTLATASVLVGLALLAIFLAGRPPRDRASGATPGRAQAGGPTGSPAAGPAADQPLTINVVYGTEKKSWLENARDEFCKRPENRGVTIDLIGKGSLEGAHMILDGESRTPIHVWSPASSAYLDVFESDWRVRRGSTPPIARAEKLALTPMVFVMWKTRYEAFARKYGTVDFRKLADAMHEPGGWGTIAGRPEWGLFKFGHTHPNKSNSGLLTLVLMAYEFSGKSRGLTASDVTDPKFQAWLRDFERGVTRHGARLTESSGTMMREMVLRGPSQYDCLMLYENLAVDYLDRARDLWDDLYVIYPRPNLWNDHPYYVLDVPGGGARERALAGRFLDFLLSEPTQREALEHGFRPGNPAVSVRVAGSSLVRAERFGVRLEVPSMAEPPRAEVIDNLLSSFQRIEP